MSNHYATFPEPLRNNQAHLSMTMNIFSHPCCTLIWYLGRWGQIRVRMDLLLQLFNTSLGS